MSRILYHYPLHPFSRKIRLMLAEKQLPFEEKIEQYWERRPAFLAMNPASSVPVLVEEGGLTLSDSNAIVEYLEEKYPERSLLRTSMSEGDHSIKEKSEVRRISGWFNNKFYYEVTKYILDEKVFKYYKRQGAPNSSAIRAAKHNILYHLDYIAYLLQKRKWLAGNVITLADLTAAAQLSVLDYLGDVPWSYNAEVKQWYAVLKSRPSFQPLLDDRLTSFKPPSYYRDLDF